MSDGPRLAPDRTYTAGIILESQRLWENLGIGAAARPVSSWTLDADYFELTAGGACLPVVIAQGAPFVADAAERLSGAGAAQVVRLGSAGGLLPHQSVGDVVVPYAAATGDGTSRAYLPRDMPALADSALAGALADALAGALNRPIRPSVSWTTDARWLESEGDFATFGGLGVASVDMETAALFAVGQRRSFAAASVSVLADIPVNDPGETFKGLPGREVEWRRVLAVARLTFTAIVEVLSR